MTDTDDTGRNLIRAKEHVASAKTLVEKQRALVADMKEKNEDADRAERLLAHLEDSLGFFERHRDRLAARAAASKSKDA